ncbi:MAG: NUDIX hydrolase [bacterium]|nr:NUDIX hydrolase [bacterium]
MQEKELTKIYIVAGVVIKQDNKYLLVQENNLNPKVHGTWNFPAGKVDKGDTIEQTAVKEAKEESGFDVELIRKIDIFQENTSEPVQHAFEAKIIGGELKWPKDEILDARWFGYNEIKKMKDKLRGKWILETIKILEN